MQATKQLTRAAGAFFSGTFLSRLSGFARDLSMAVCFGATPTVAAFMLAFRFANLARRLLGETPLTSSFIPHFETLRTTSEKDGLQFFADFLLSLGIVLIALIAPAMLLLPHTEVCDLTRLMLPGLFFICLFGLSSAYLQCEKRFFVSGALPMTLNIVWIGIILNFRHSPEPIAMRFLALGVVGAFALQWLLASVPIAKQLNWAILKKARPFSSQVRAMMMPFALGILGVGASQINSALDALFARSACLEGPAYLWYAIRMQQLPLILFGMAWSTALLPALSNASDSEQLPLLHHAINRCALFLIPVTFALLPCASAGVNLLFGHGDFSPDAVYKTTQCLWAYGVGLFPAALVMMLSARFYSKKDFRTPSMAALICVGTNIGLNALLVYGFQLGAASVALATSATQFINAYLLLRKCNIGSLKLSKLIGASVLAAVIAALLYPDPVFTGGEFPRAVLAQIKNLVFPFLAFCALMTLQWKWLKRLAI